MQGALKVSIAVMVVAGAAPASASAQLLDVPPVQVPPVSVPPVTLPAPLPQVSTPPLSTPPVSIPGVRVDAPLPALPPAPQVPQVRAPVPPPPPAPALDSAPTARPSGFIWPRGALRRPSPRAGTPSASPARGGRVARAAAVRGGRGVLGTSYRSRRRLVRALSACVAGLPARQERLLVMRYGLGATAAHPDGSVAGMLGLSRGKYGTLRRRALRGIVRDARDGGCRDGVAVTTPPAIAFGDGRGGALWRRPPAAGRCSGDAEIAVRGERASGGTERADDDGGRLTTPLALDAREPEGSLLGALMLAAALGLLAVIGVRAVRARVRR